MSKAALRESRQRAWRRGRWAEALCRLALRLKGYRILAVNLRTPVGEIDIVARRGRMVAIIEVKARDRGADPGLVPAPRQRRRIARAAAAFLSMNPALADLSVRFDVMSVAGRRWPRHLPDAWREDGW